jgi:protein involved in polysaccharide export with SLBB domain
VALVFFGDKDVNMEMVHNGFADIKYVDLSPMIDELEFRASASVGASRDSPIVVRGESRHGTFQDGEDVTVTEHVLAPGDRIRVIVGSQTQDFAINPDGEILIRGLGVIRFGDKTSAQAGADLDSAIRARGITVSPVTVFYLAPPAKPQRTVMVVGAIRRTGNYPATTLLGAISSADGLTPEANPTEVRVTLGESTTIVNAGRIMIGEAPDLKLQGGEVIIVPTYPRIFVSGAVARPNWVTAQYLSEAVSVAGGPLPEADLTNVELRALTDSPIRINAQAVFSGELDDVRLNDRDRITIPIRARAIAPAIQVYGPVQRPGTRQGFTVVDAVREAVPDTRADLTQVIIDRGEADSITVNAQDMALGHEQDIDLKTGDRVLIPRRNEPIPEAAQPDTPQTVTVLGDVTRPGPVQPGPLTQVLAQVGGPKTTARLQAIHVRHPGGQAQIVNLTRITTGKEPDPDLPPGATVFVESDEPRRQGLADLRILIGIASALLLFAGR